MQPGQRAAAGRNHHDGDPATFPDECGGGTARGRAGDPLGGFTGQIALVVLYALLDGCLSLALGLLIGAVFNTVSAATAVEGPLILVFIVAGNFTGELGQALSSSPAYRIARILPTYYIAEGTYNASRNLGSLGSNLLDAGVVLGSTLVLLAISAWALRRQSAVLALI